MEAVGTHPVVAGWGRLPEACAAGGAGVLLVALSYVAGRRGITWGPWPYWAGELMLFLAPVVLLCLRRPVTDVEAGGAAVLLAVTTYLVKVCYSPTRLLFPDELEHWRTAETILGSQHLFGANPALPISPVYPGLESATVAMASTTGLSVTTSGLVLVGVAHLLTCVALYKLLRQIGVPGRFAGLGVCVYGTGPHFQFFDAMYVYQAIALPFLVLTLVATAHLLAAGPVRQAWYWGAAAVVFGGVVVVSHPVTTYAMLVILGAVMVSGAVLRRREVVRRTGAVLLVLLVWTAAWMAVVAPGTLSYFGPVADELGDGVLKLLGLRRAAPSSGLAIPQSGGTWDHFFSYAAVVLTLCALAWAGQRLWRRGLLGTWSVALALCGLGYVFILAVRVLAPDGAELWGRAMTYVLLAACFLVALAARDLLGSVRHGRTRQMVTVASASVLFVGGIAAGWPPAWERLPHSYLVDGYESSVSSQGLAVSAWARRYLGPDNRFGTDAGNYGLIGTVGWQDPVRNVAELYYTPTWTAGDGRLVAKTYVQYLLVDRRLSQQLPAGGSYFPVDPEADEHHTPIPLKDLTKFDKVRDISRVYDNGDIVVYWVAGAAR